VSEVSAMKAFLLLLLSAAAEFAHTDQENLQLRRLQAHPAAGLLGNGLARLKMAAQVETLPSLPDACATACPEAQVMWAEMPALLDQIPASPDGLLLPMSLQIRLQLDLFCKHPAAMNCMIQDVLYDSRNTTACSSVMLLLAPDFEAQNTAEILNSQIACGCTGCPGITIMVQALYDFIENMMFITATTKDESDFNPARDEYDFIGKMCPTMDTFECARANDTCQHGFSHLLSQFQLLLGPNPEETKAICRPATSGSSINMPVIFTVASAMVVIFW